MRMRALLDPAAFAGLFLIAALLTAAAPAAAVKIPVFGKKEAAPYVPSGQWEAYIKDDKGRSRPLLQPVEKNEDKDWMFLQYTEYQGPRNRLAVMKVENKIASAEQAEGSNALLVTKQIAEVPVSALEELLTTALSSTHRFDLVERKQLQTILAEQDFGDSGRVNPQTAAKIGEVLGAEHLIHAAVNEWTPEKKRVGGGGFGAAGPVLGGIGLGKATAEIAMSFRIVDATTGQILTSLTERATAGNWGITAGGIGGLGGGTGSYSKSSPIGYAVQACINKAVYKIAMALKNRPWRGSVVSVDNGKVYINAGSNHGMQVGMSLTALAKGKALIDPETGIKIGSATEAVGNLTVTAVNEGFSVAAIVQGCENLKTGDIVELASTGP